MSEPVAGAPLWLLPPPVLLPQRSDSKARWLDRIETIVTGVPALALPPPLARTIIAHHRDDQCAGSGAAHGGR